MRPVVEGGDQWAAWPSRDKELGKSKASNQAWAQEAGGFAELWQRPALVVRSSEKVCATQDTRLLAFVFLPAGRGIGE